MLNDRNKISSNILLNHHVKVLEYEGKKILEIHIPAADRHDKPVYIGTNPMKGTYRRDYEGDFLCTEASVLKPKIPSETRSTSAVNIS